MSGTAIWREAASAARDEHLARVEAALADTLLEAELRCGIVADLREQIAAMAEARAVDGTVSHNVIEEILDELDPPEALAAGVREQAATSDGELVDGASRRPADERLGVLALALSLGGLVLWPVISILGDAAGGDGGEAGWVLFCFAQLAALVCAAFARRSRSARVAAALVVVQALVITALVLLFP